MPIYSGKWNLPLILLHGGAGQQDPMAQKIVEATQELNKIALAALSPEKLRRSRSEIVADCLYAMEAHELFNAGKGAALQSDGQTRLTAAFMDGPKQSFSGVVSVSYLSHPSKIAIELQNHSSRVLGVPGAELIARSMGLPLDSNLTAPRVANWVERCKNSPGLGDTVGVLLANRLGELAVGASTGGRGFEFPGRMSDSATVAGTYASRYLAVAATGTGEEIVDDALAARMETRVRDGLSLAEASQRAYDEALELKRSYGWIAVDPEGYWSIAYTSAGMSFTVRSGEGDCFDSSALFSAT